jgi:dTDP-glucose 4,6-dehydratase
MRILVTGGSGFIGSNLVRLLLTEKSETVINLDKLSYASTPDTLKDFVAHPNYIFEQVDLCDLTALLTAFKKHEPHAVMHLAAESHVDRSINDPKEFIQSNIVGTFNLLQTSLAYWRNLPPKASALKPQPSKESFRHLHVSTDEVYGSLQPEAASGFTETSRYAPHSPYSASKASSDHLTRAWHDTYGLPVLITNCSNNYGPYQFPEKLIPVVILKCLRNEPIPIYGDGLNIRDWLYVDDHTEALYTVLTKGRIGETYNIGGNNEQTNIELVRRLCAWMDELHPQTDKSHQDLITFTKDRLGHDQRYAINSNKIRNELGWHPKEDFNSSLRKTVKWYLNNQNWWRPSLADVTPHK